MLEAIAKDIQDVKDINQTNAKRIELVDGINHGGLTPKLEVIEEATRISKIPVVVMVRNHWDNFYITQEQLDEVLKQIKDIKENTQTKEIIWGAITKDNTVDENALAQVVKASHPELKVVFHKAFDLTNDKVKALETLKKHGVVRVLTSGGEGDPIKNKEVLKTMKNKGVDLLIGGGVTLENLPEIKDLGFKDIHMGSKLRKNGDYKYSINDEIINHIAEELK